MFPLLSLSLTWTCHGKLPWLGEVLREFNLLLCEQNWGTGHLLHGYARCLPMGEEYRIRTDNGRSPLLIIDSVANSNWTFLFAQAPKSTFVHPKGVNLILTSEPYITLYYWLVCAISHISGSARFCGDWLCWSMSHYCTLWLEAPQNQQSSLCWARVCCQCCKYCLSTSISRITEKLKQN